MPSPIHGKVKKIGASHQTINDFCMTTDLLFLYLFIYIHIGLNHVCPKLLVYSVTGMMRSAFRYYLMPRSTPPQKKKQRKLLVLAWRDMFFFLCSSLPVQNKTCANHEVKVKKNSVQCLKINSQNPEIFWLAACPSPSWNFREIMAKCILLCSKVKGQPEEVGRNAAHEEELQQIAKVPPLQRQGICERWASSCLGSCKNNWQLLGNDSERNSELFFVKYV